MCLALYSAGSRTWDFMHVKKTIAAELYPQQSCYLLYKAFLDYLWLSPPTPHSSDFLAVSQGALYSLPRLLHTGLSFISIIMLLYDFGFVYKLRRETEVTEVTRADNTF